MPQAPAVAETAPQTRAAQKHVFWASYFGWLLDGFDTTIHAFVLVPAFKQILPATGISASETPHWGLTFFAIFLAGWRSGCRSCSRSPLRRAICRCS